MAVEIYLASDDKNLLAKSILLKKFIYYREIPEKKIKFVVDNIFTSLAGADFTLHGMWYDWRNPEELVFVLTKRYLLGYDQSCWLYHNYTDDFGRLRNNDMFFDVRNIPCYIPLIQNPV